MGFSVTASGVDWTRGRGKNAVRLSFSFAELDRWARTAKKNTAELWRLSYGRAAAGLKKKFAQIMTAGGGVLGVPKFRDFEEFTKQLRARRGRTDHMGGILADKHNIVAFKRGGSQIVGWPDSLENVANNFQDGAGGTRAEAWFTEPGMRKALHREGVRNIPRAYKHNPREVIAPYFVDHVKARLDEWAKGAYYKAIAKLMAGKVDRKVAFV